MFGNPPDLGGAACRRSARMAASLRSLVLLASTHAFLYVEQNTLA
jgi:hypothetical protein